MPYAFDKHSVEKLIEEFVFAWNKADAKLFRAVLEDEATVVEEAARVKGRAKGAKALAARAQEGELRLAAMEFKAFHPNIVLCEASWVLAGGSAQGTVLLVATCGPDRWAVEWVRFLPYPRSHES